MKQVSKDQFASNALWKFTEIIVRKVIALVISTILARLLAPEAYGVVALTTVFITFSDIFILNGFNVAIIRKDKVEEEDYSTVMILSLAFSAIVYTILFFAAPALSAFYKSPELKNVLRVITVLIFFQSVATVIRAKATRELKFKQMSFVAIIGNVSASIVALIMAYAGMGVWALVVQQVLANFFDMVLLTLVFKWKYTWKFSKEKAGDMLKFTLGVLGASFLDFLGNNANSLVIGRAFNTSELAYYNRGNMYPETISLNTYNSINSVLLPTLSSRQNDIEEMKKVVRRVVSITEYIILPMMIGLIAISDRFVSVLLTHKWDACIPVMICACLYYSINPIRAIGYNVFYARGESKRNVKIEMTRSIIMITTLVIVIILLKQSIYVLAASNVIIALLVAMFTQHQVNKCIGYKYRELFADILPALVMSLIMGAIVKGISLFTRESAVVFIVQLFVGVCSYVLMSAISKNENYKFIKNYALNRLPKRKKHE